MKLGTWDVHWTLSERWKNTKRWRWLAWNQLWYDRGRRILIFRQIGFLRFDKLAPKPGEPESKNQKKGHENEGM